MICGGITDDRVIFEICTFIVWKISLKRVIIGLVHLCRDAALCGGLSHDTFFDSVGLAVLS